MVSNEKNITFDEIWKEIPETELKRQVLHHEIVYKACNNKLSVFFIKDIIDEIKKDKKGIILNLGSGYGIWSRKFVEEYEENGILILIIDIDVEIEKYIIYKISDNFEKYLNNSLGFSIIPDKSDLKNKINYKNNTINYIYQRDMISIYNNFEWDHLLSEIYRVLKNGGYFEIVEYNFIVKHEDNNNSHIFTDIIINYLKELFDKNNHIYNSEILYNKVKNWFKIVEISSKKLPLYYENIYKGICIDNLLLGFNNIRQELDKVLKNNVKCSFDESLKILKNEWYINKSYIEIYFIYGRKL